MTSINSRTRRASLVLNSRQRAMKREPPVMWNIQGMRGQTPANCLWHACKALIIGIIFFCLGTSMSVMGFYSDVALEAGSNTTLQDELFREAHYDHTRPALKYGKLSFLGPIVMGIGGFIIVATCVMTFEARDSSAKVGPAALGVRSSASAEGFPRTFRPNLVGRRVNDRRNASSQTNDSLTSLNLVGALPPQPLFDRKAIIDTFRKFSKTLRSTTTERSSSERDEDLDDFYRSPSAPSLLSSNTQIRSGGSGLGGGHHQHHHYPSSTSTSNVNTPTSMRKSMIYLSKQNKYNMIRSPPALLRQTMSVDSSSPSRIPAGRHSKSKSSSSCKKVPRVSGSSSPGALGSAKRVSRHVSIAIPESDDLLEPGGGGGVPIKGQEDRPVSGNEDRIQLKNVSANVHCNPEADLGLGLVPPVFNGLSPKNSTNRFTVISPSSNVSSSSGTSLRTISPFPGAGGLSSDDDTGSIEQLSIKSEISHLPSIMTRVPPTSSKHTLSKEFSSNRPQLLRQTRVEGDHSEIFLVPNTVDEVGRIIIGDNLGTIQESE